MAKRTLYEGLVGGDYIDGDFHDKDIIVSFIKLNLFFLSSRCKIELVK